MREPGKPVAYSRLRIHRLIGGAAWAVTVTVEGAATPAVARGGLCATVRVGGRVDHAASRSHRTRARRTRQGFRLLNRPRLGHREMYPKGYNSQVRVEKTAEYSEWIDSPKDRAGRARILMRVDRLVHGNPGQCRELANGVSELKIDVGPGYRVYYMQRGNVLLLLLAGGDKSTQQKDIARAIRLASIHEE